MLRYAPKAFAGEADIKPETSRQAQFTSQAGEQPHRNGGSVNKLIYFGNLSLCLSLSLFAVFVKMNDNNLAEDLGCAGSIDR